MEVEGRDVEGKFGRCDVLVVVVNMWWRIVACSNWCAVLGSGMAWYVALVLYVCEVDKDSGITARAVAKPL